jgi:DNA-binding NarL/FixJ family response regulator
MGRVVPDRHHRHNRGSARGHSLVLLNGLDDGRDPVSEPVSVLIVGAGGLARAGLGALLDAQPEMAVDGFAASEAEAVALAEKLHPDVLLVDATQTGTEAAGIDALQLTRRLAADAETAAVRVLIVGSSELDDEILSALRAGATGFLSRDTDADELVAGVRAVGAGEAALSPSGVRRLIVELASQPDPRLPRPEELEELTARELEVVALVAAGLSNEEIAEQLVVANATAKTHVSRAMSKLRAHHRAQLVTLAYETGLVLARQPATRGFDRPAARSAAA